eukprot:COSAG02_NODE_43756_length_372_cov_0.564103_1_plen_63_part_10
MPSLLVRSREGTHTTNITLQRNINSVRRLSTCARAGCLAASFSTSGIICHQVALRCLNVALPI